MEEESKVKKLEMKSKQAERKGEKEREHIERTLTSHYYTRPLKD